MIRLTRQDQPQRASIPSNLTSWWKTGNKTVNIRNRQNQDAIQSHSEFIFSMLDYIKPQQFDSIDSNDFKVKRIWMHFFEKITILNDRLWVSRKASSLSSVAKLKQHQPRSLLRQLVILLKTLNRNFSVSFYFVLHYLTELNKCFIVYCQAQGPLSRPA